jgi:hypothetical protein
MRGCDEAEAAATLPAIARRTLLRAAALGSLCCLAASPLALAQNAAIAASEQSIKAAYLFKLPAYVDWPPGRFVEPSSAFTIGVLGADDVATELASLTAGRTMNGRPLAIRRLSQGELLDGVHVLFFSGAAFSASERIAMDAAAHGILTVTDSPGGSQDSVVSFVNVNGRLRFEVRLGAAQRNGLRLHSGLLGVAARVHGAAP